MAKVPVLMGPVPRDVATTASREWDKCSLLLLGSVKPLCCPIQEGNEALWIWGPLLSFSVAVMDCLKQTRHDPKLVCAQDQ